jgi:hypothetical protein
MEGVKMTRPSTLIKYLFLGFFILTGGIVSTADAWTVPGDFPTIQAAIDDPCVFPGNTITVIGNPIAPPVYSGPGFYNVDFNGKDLVVQTGDANDNYVPRSAIIDCQNLGRAFIFQSGEGVSPPFTFLRGFIIINGYAEDTSWPREPNDNPSGYGGAIYIKDSTPVITNCMITNCTADAGGGAIFCDENGDAQISACDIGLNISSYNYAGWGFYRYIDPCDANDVNTLDVNDLHQYGGGIYAWKSNPRIINCNIGYNVVEGSGGGIACISSNALIRDCTIMENDARIISPWDIADTIDQHGGGIFIKDCKGRGPEIERGTIIWNAARWSGGGIAVIDSNSRIFGTLALPPQPVRIEDNHCWASAGGIYCQGNPSGDPNIDPNNPNPNCVIETCIIANNWGYWSGGASSNYGSYMTFTTSVITRNIASWSWLVGGLEAYGGGGYDANGVIVWDNTGGVQQTSAGVSASAMGLGFSSLEMASSGINSAINVTYSNIQMFDSDGFYDPSAVWPGEGNINKDPMFVNPIRYPFDFHLLSTSPCINAGDPFADYSLEPAPNGGRINIGAYGGTEEATSSDILRPVPSDADTDLNVNMVDFAIFANNWGLEGASIKNKRADSDNNNIVDGRDMAILGKFWLWQQ